MSVVVEVGDPVVYLLAFGQPYAAEVVATDSADPPVLTVSYAGRQVTGVPYNARAQAPNTWCRYTDPGRPGTLPDPDLVITPALYLTQADADARYLTPGDAGDTYLTQAEAATTYLTQSQADDLYQPITP